MVRSYPTFTFSPDQNASRWTVFRIETSQIHFCLHKMKDYIFFLPTVGFGGPVTGRCSVTLIAQSGRNHLIQHEDCICSRAFWEKSSHRGSEQTKQRHCTLGLKNTAIWDVL